MKSKVPYTILTMLMVATFVLAACSPQAAPAPATQPPQAEQPTQPPAATSPELLRVWIQWGDNPAQIQALFDKYTAKTGVKVEVTAPLQDDMILPALTGSAPPDILVLSGGDLVKSYAKEGMVTPLDEAIKTGGIDLTDIYDAPLNQCRSEGQILCLPWGTDLYALFWNKDLFEAAGLDPNTPPQTMEELAEFSDKLTKVGADGKVEQIGFIPDHSWSHNDLYTRMMGGFWYNEDGTQLTANSQPVIDSLLWQQQFYSKYGYDNVLSFTSGFGEYSSPDHPFYAGKMAMMVEGEWQTGPNFISNFKPELNYGVAPFPPPAAHPERKGTAVVQGTVVVIPAGAKNKEASARLLAWMMSPEVVAEEMCTNANLPTSKKAAADPCFTSNPKFKVFVDLMGSPNTTYIITTPISLEFNDAIGSVEEQVLHTGADAKKLLDELQAEFAPKLEEALK